MGERIVLRLAAATAAAVDVVVLPKPDFPRRRRIVSRRECAPEVIKLRGDRLYVRTYDRDVVARIVR